MDSEKNGFWKFIERSKLVAELTATLIVISPILAVIFKQGLSATAPIWVVLLVAIFAIGFGYLLGRNANIFSLSTIKRNSLQKIDFNYTDTPVNHKWSIGECNDPTQISFKSISDGYVGKALEIFSPVRYRLDYNVEQLASFGSRIEFEAKLDSKSYLLTRIRVQGKETSQSRDLWLTFCAGNEPPKRIDDGRTWYEFMVPVIPKKIGNGWARFDIDLREKVQITGGVEAGWKFSSLQQIRLRGNMSIARIEIYEK